MNKKFYILLCAAVLAVVTATAAESVPYSMSFNNTLGDWTTQDDSGGYPYWQTGPNGVYCMASYGVTNDDYLISPEIAFEAGKTYEVTTTWHGNTYGGPHTVNVMYGTGDDVSAFTDAGAVEVVAGESTSVQFTIAEAGNYKVALHNTTVADYGACYLPSLTINEVEGGGSGDETATLPYDYNFLANGFGDWLSYRGENSSSYQGWSYEEGYGVFCQVFTGSNDDYLISPLFTFEAGKSYQVTVSLGSLSLSGGNGDNISVMLGTSTDGSGYTDAGALDLSPATSPSVTFSVETSGDYRIALHNTCGMMSTWYVENIAIAEVVGGSDEVKKVPYTKDFQADYASGLGEWTQYDANNDGAVWENSFMDLTEYGDELYLFGVVVQSNGAHDDYLISPLISLEAGSYKVTVTMGDNTNDGAIELMYGTSTDNTGWTLIDNLDCSPATVNEKTFTVDQAGNYRIALHDITANGIYGTPNVFSVSIDEIAGGSTVEELQLPYKFDFSANGVGDWATLDANEDGYTWAESGSGASFGIVCREAGDGLGANNDYIVSPGQFTFEGGKIYDVTIAMGGFCTSGTINGGYDLVEVVVGSGDDFTSYESMGRFALAGGSDATVHLQFDETRTCRVGIHDAGNMSVWYVTSISIAEYEEPELPAGVLLDKDFNDRLLNDWTTIDGNNDEATWHFEDNLTGVALTRSRGTAQNDWLISPAMTFEAGKSYIVSYTLGTSGSPMPETLETAYGTSATAEAMTNVIGSESFQGDTTCYYRITPTAGGAFHIGFHATSDAGNGTILVVSASVVESEGITPLAPVGLSAESDIRQSTVDLSWTNPVIDTENIPLQGNLTLRIVRNGEQVAEISGEPGATMQYTDRPADFSGYATYQIYAYVDSEKLSEAVETTINLDDFQGEASVLYTAGGSYGGDFQNWTATNVSGTRQWSYTLYDDSWQISRGTSAECDNWLISGSPINMTTDRRYVVEVEVRSGVGYPAGIELYLGQGNSVSSMTQGDPVYSFSAEGNGAITYTSDQFVVDEDGDYYMAIRATSITTMTSVLRYTVYYYENGGDPLDTPWSENFDGDAEIAAMGWKLGDGTFAIADGAMVSTSNGEARNETIFSPLVNMKAGYTYEISFDYAYAGSGDFAFNMAGGQSDAELIAESHTVLDGAGQECRYLFTPTRDGSYCAAWQLATTADDNAAASIDNLSFGVNIYVALPFDENFDSYMLNAIPTGWSGAATTTGAGSDDIVAALDSEASTPWFYVNNALDSYTIAFDMTNSASVEINATFSDGSTANVGTCAAGSGWTEQSFAIPQMANAVDPYSVRLSFTSADGSTVQIDNVAVTRNPRAVVAGAPYNFRAYPDGTIVWMYPQQDSEGNNLELGTEVTVTIYDGDEVIATETGTITTNEYGSLLNQGNVNVEYSDVWTNSVKLFRATASIDGVAGKSATWILRQNDDLTFSNTNNIYCIADYDFSADEQWSNDGWTIDNGTATATSGTPSMSSPNVELSEGQLYMVRYYIATDADYPADFTVTVGSDSQVFNGAHIGLNTFDWNLGATSEFIGQPQYIDFMLSRIEDAGNYAVEIAASNIGSSISVSRVQVYEVREYATICEAPYENDFEDLATPSGEIEPNWYLPWYTNYWRIDDMSNYGATAASGNRALVAPSTTDLDVTAPQDFVYTPYLAAGAGKTYRVEFDYYMPSSATGLAFIYAYSPTYTDGEYQVIAELPQSTEWTHYELITTNTGEDGTLLFGFVSYATDTRDNVTAIDNFRYVEVTGTSVDEIDAGGKIFYYNGSLNIPGNISSVMVYDLQGRMVFSTTETGQVSLDGIGHGVYVVKGFSTSGLVQTVKIVK